MVYLPLVDALLRRASLDEIRSILQDCPEESRRGDALSEVLGLALLLEASADIEKLLIRQDPSVLYKNLTYSQYPLRVVNLLLLLDRDEIGTDEFGDSPLNCLLRNERATLLMVQLLVEHFPDSVRMGGPLGQHLPLHSAAGPWCRVEILRFLLEQYPEGARVVGNNNILPLHRCCEFGSVEAVRLLLDAYPEGLDVLGQFCERYPLHYACSNETTLNPWDAVQHILDVNSNALSCQDIRGYLPIHPALENTAHMVPIHLVQRMLELYPDSARLATNYGELPLHCAFGRDRFASLETIQVLLEHYPAAVSEEQTEAGWLPLHKACCFLSQTPGTEQIRLLVQAAPLTVLRKETRSVRGHTPLQLLFQNPQPDTLAVHQAKRLLLEQQEIVVQSYHDAVEDAVQSFMDGAAPHPTRPDLVVGCIWKFAQPGVWWPPGHGDGDH